MAWYIATSAVAEQGAAVGVAGTAEHGPALGVARLDRDSCAGVDDHLEAIDVERPGDDAGMHVRTKASISSTVLRTPLSVNSSPANRATRSPGAEHAGESPCDLDEQFVTGVVTERVVHLFEAVEVEHDDERSRSLLERPSADPCEVVFEGGAVGKSGEEVMVRLELQMTVHQTASDGATELVGDRSEATKVGVGEGLRGHPLVR